MPTKMTEWKKLPIGVESEDHEDVKEVRLMVAKWRCQYNPDYRIEMQGYLGEREDGDDEYSIFSFAADTHRELVEWITTLAVMMQEALGMALELEGGDEQHQP